jgi:hypothetical protein
VAGCAPLRSWNTDETTVLNKVTVAQFFTNNPAISGQPYSAAVNETLTTDHTSVDTVISDADDDSNQRNQSRKPRALPDAQMLYAQFPHNE